MKDVPEELDKIVRVVLAYRPKPKTKAARKRLGATKDKNSKAGERK